MRVNISASGIRQTKRTETLTQYFNDIPKNTYLSVEETVELYHLYKTETNPRKKEMYKTKIINANLLFVVSIAKRYATEGTLMDVIQEGNIGLLKALESYNPSKDASLITYAVNFIVREINDYKTRRENLVRQKNRCKTFHIQARAKEMLFKEYGREPTTEEMRDYINTNYGRYAIKHASDLVSVKMTYVDDAALNGDEISVNAGEIADYNNYSASHNTCVDEAEKEHNSMLTQSLIKTLKPVEQETIKYAFGIGHFREYTNAEIGEKLGYTTERIRQIKEEAMRKLKKAFLKKYAVA